MTKIKSNNVPSLTIERIIDSLTSAYVKIINAKMPIKTFLAQLYSLSKQINHLY